MGTPQTGYYDRDRTNSTAGIPAGQMNHTYSHHSNVSEYQSSGIPFVARVASVAMGTKKTINFPFVTRWVMVNVYTTTDPSSLQNDATVAFSDGGSAADVCVSAYLCARQRLEIKCKKLVVTTGASGTTTIEVIAGLTGVKDFPNQDASHVSGISSITKDGVDSSGTAIDFAVFS
jgi:hypothetical protein